MTPKPKAVAARTWSHDEVMRFAGETIDLFIEYANNQNDPPARAKNRALAELDGALAHEERISNPTVRS